METDRATTEETRRTGDNMLDGPVERSKPPQDLVVHFRVGSTASPDADRQTLDPAEWNMRCTGRAGIWIDDRYRALGSDPRLADVDAVMQSGDGVCQRILRDRENWIWDHAAGDRTPRRAFLKKHHVRTLASRIRALLGLGPGETAGRVEARRAKQLHAHGIPCLTVMAWGERLRNDGALHSFFLSDELRGYEPLDDFIRRRFPPTNDPDCHTRDRDLGRLVRDVAILARRFHDAGFNHRDLYCCHFYVKETGPGVFDLRLIDLQRVQYRTCRRGRWIVKDLAQLAYSAPPRQIGRTARLAFLLAYLGVERQRPRHRRLMRRVLAKQRRMERKLGPLLE